MSYNETTGLYEGFIYLITNSVNDKVYIGQTRDSVESRWKSHVYGKKTIIDKTIKRYGEESFSIETIEKIECDSKEELIVRLNEQEIYWISYYDSRLPNGYNVGSGGDVSDFSDRMYYQFDLDGNFINSYFGLTKVEEWIRANCDVKPNVNIARAIRVNRHEGRPTYNYIWELTDSCDLSKYARKPLGKVRIDQYDISGNFIATYNTISDAVRELGRDQDQQSGIKKQLDGKTFYPQSGYVWRYHGDPFDKYPVEEDHSRDSKSIDKYDLFGNFIYQYASILDAAKSVGKNKKTGFSGITKCCNGELSYSYGYVWRFWYDAIDKYPLPQLKYINCYTLDDMFIKQYSCYKDASFLTFPDLSEKQKRGIAGNIRNCLVNSTNISHGYKWYYYYDNSQPNKSMVGNVLIEQSA